jgi:WD40 repeat protein
MGYLNTAAFDRAGRSLLVSGSWAWLVFDSSKEEMVPRTRSAWLDLKEFGVIRSAALSPDGRAVATGMRETKALLWDADTGNLVRRTGEHLNLLDAVAFRPDGATLLTYSSLTANPLSFWKERAGLWDVKTGRRLRSLLRELAPEVNRLALHPDGRTLLLGCRDGTARFWDLETNRPEGEPLRHAGSVTAVAFGPDAARFLTGCRDGTLRQWDTATRRPLGEPVRHPREVSAAVFSPTGETILAGDLEGTARFWDCASGQQLGIPLRHAGAIIAVAFHPDGRRVVTAGMDHRVRQWRVPPPPVPGSPERIRRWVEGLTGLEMDDAGVVHRLAPEVLAERLQEEGGRSGGNDP